MLYLADYVEPGRTYERQMLDAWIERTAAEPRAVLREVAALAHRVAAQGRRLDSAGNMEFWNRHRRGPASSSPGLIALALAGAASALWWRGRAVPGAGCGGEPRDPGERDRIVVEVLNPTRASAWRAPATARAARCRH